MPAELADRFARFRQEQPRGTRVPDELRTAALAALQEGVTPGDLYRACGVAWGQVKAWKAGRGSVAAKRREAKACDARVFSIVDEPPGRSAESAVSAGRALELRLGPWSICVRLTDSERVERG